VSELPISCYIRTLNEEARIERAVRDAFKVAAEVVIVDCGSTDRTQQIAEAAGARVVHQDWLGNGGQKRAGEDLCRHDWLLDLDADEYVSDALAANIRAAFADGAPDKSVYQLKLVTVPPYGKTWYGFSTAWRSKLYDRRRHRMPDHGIWDQLELPKSVKPGRIEGPLLHESFSGIAQQAHKLNRGSSVRAREAKLKSKWSLTLRVIGAMPIYFARHYFIKGLWRAGVYGYAIAWLAAYGRWLRDVKMLETHYARAQGREPEL